MTKRTKINRIFLEEMMYGIELRYFVKDETFPLYIGFGIHKCDFPLHYHVDFTELVIVLSGTATHIVENERFFIRKGDVFVITGNTQHAFENVNELILCNAMFSLDGFVEDNSDILNCEGFRKLFYPEKTDGKPHFTARLTLSLESFGQIHEMISTAINECSLDLEARKTILTGYLNILVAKLSRMYVPPVDEENIETRSIGSAVSYMEDNLSEKITLDTLAEISGFSKRHFTRLFSAAYNISPTRYLNKLRLQKACRLLRTTDMTVSEISGNCGFYDSNYFSCAFSAEYNLSPTEYRKAR